MDWKQRMNQIRKGIINGTPEPKQKQEAPAQPKTKLMQMLDERRATQKKPEDNKQQTPETAPAQPDQTQEKTTVQTQAKEPEQKQQQQAESKTETQQKVVVELDGNDVATLREILDLSKQQKQQETPTQQPKQSETQATAQPDQTQQQQTQEQAPAQPAQTQQTAQAQTQQQTPAQDQLPTHEKPNEEQLPDVVTDRIAASRNALKRNNGAWSTTPIGEVFKAKCKDRGIPEPNQELMMSACLLRGLSLEQENLDATINEAAKEFPILSRSTQIPSVIGGTNVTPRDDHNGLTLEQRAAKVREKIKNM